MTVHHLISSVSGKTVFIAKLFAVLCVSQFTLPTTINPNDFRQIDQPLKIRSNKTSPSYAALADSFAFNETPAQENKAISEEELFAGKKLNLIQPLHVATVELSEEQLPAAPVPRLTNKRGELLPIAERKEKLISHYSAQSFKQPSVQKAARDLVAQVISQQPTNSNIKVVPTQTMAPIIVAKAKEPEQKAENGKKSTTIRTTKQKSDKEKEWGGRFVASNDQRYIPEQDREISQIGMFALEDNNEAKQFVLSGEVQLTGGIAFTGVDNFISINRIVEGVVVDTAEFWLQEGRYEIVAQELKGYLVAELRNNYGELLGAAKLDLYNLEKLPYAQQKIEHLNLEIKPLEQGLNLQVVSARSFSNYRLSLTDALVYIQDLNRQVLAEDDTYRDTDFAMGSNYLIAAEKSGHWGTLALGASHQQQKLKLYPNKMIEALISFARPQQQEDQQEYSVVWGQVAKNSKALAGAAVEMVGAEYIGPIYFKSYSDMIYLPDTSLKATSENGYYAFLVRESGLVSVRAKVGEGYLPSKLTPVEFNYVSEVNFSINELKAASVKVHQAFTNERLPASMKVLGADLVVDLTGTSKDKFNYSTGVGLMTLEFDAGKNHPMLRSFVRRDFTHIDIPVVHYDWVDGILNEKEIDIDHDKGVVIGFVEGDDFTVRLPQSQQQIYYFDADGRLVESDVGPAGGGYIIFNLNEGMQTAVVLSENSTKISTQIFVSEGGYYSLVQSQLK